MTPLAGLEANTNIIAMDVALFVTLSVPSVWMYKKCWRNKNSVLIFGRVLDNYQSIDNLE